MPIQGGKGRRILNQPRLTPGQSKELRKKLLRRVFLNGLRRSCPSRIHFLRPMPARSRTRFASACSKPEMPYQPQRNRDPVNEPLRLSSQPHRTLRRTGRFALPKELRRRRKSHLLFVREQPCLICQQTSSDVHHLKFAQPRPLGRMVSDEFTVPLCRVHHQDLH